MAFDTALDPAPSIRSASTLATNPNNTLGREYVDLLRELVEAIGKHKAALDQIDGLVLGGAAWTAYTPTVTANSGSYTSASATGRYQTFGKMVAISATVTITTVGTGAAPIFSLPFTAAAHRYYLAGRENLTTGKMIVGAIDISASSAIIFYYDNTDPSASGASLTVTGVYERA